MHTAPAYRRPGAWAFVLAAIALAVGATLVTRGGDHVHQVPIAGAPKQQHIFNSTRPAAAVAALASGATGELAPLRARDFAAPVARYRAYADGEVGVLKAQTRALTHDLQGGDRAAARADWQRADSTFARIGAAYGALGTLGDAIDGAPGGLSGGAHDAHFTGLQRIEQGLWGGVAPASLTGYGRRLQAAVGRLGPVLRNAPIDPLTYATRAHEILEDVQRDRLSADTPSHSGVRATADGVAATQVVLNTLSPVLRGRGDALTESRFWLAKLTGVVQTIRRAHGGNYPSTVSLSRIERERLDGTLGAALEALRAIPGELETKLPPVFHRIPRR